MKAVLLFILLVAFFSNGMQTISRTNYYAREAAKAYKEEDYAFAIGAYEYLLNELQVEDDQIRLNLAHSYYRAYYLDQAKSQYQLLTKHPSPRIRALATLQLGNVAALQRNFKRALSLYRSALVAEPGNENARYNFELMKKYLDRYPELLGEEEPAESDAFPEDDPLAIPPPDSREQEAPAPKKMPDAQGTDQEKTDSREQTEQGEQEEKEGAGKQQPDEQVSNQPGDKEKDAGRDNGNTAGLNPDNNTDTGQPPLRGTEQISEEDQRAQMQRERLQQMNLTPEKARMLLEAMRNAELQYIQQLPKKTKRKPDTSKPDW